MMLAFATVPEPFVTEHICPAGAATTVTLYAVPLASAFLKAKLPLSVSARLSPALSCRVTDPLRPTAVPPIV
jgi:hypothetical protein